MPLNLQRSRGGARRSGCDVGSERDARTQQNLSAAAIAVTVFGGASRSIKNMPYCAPLRDAPGATERDADRDINAAKNASLKTGKRLPIEPAASARPNHVVPGLPLDDVPDPCLVQQAVLGTGPLKITSRDNAVWKRLRELTTSGKARRDTHRAILDGTHLAECFALTGASAELVVLSENANDEVRRCAQQINSAQTIELSATLFTAVSSVETPTGILVVIEPPAARSAVTGSCVVLDTVQDAGNVGSILRSAAAAGIGHAVLSPGCAQAWSPKVLRAGMGAHFALAIHDYVSISEALRSYSGQVLATRADAERTIYETDLRTDVAWLLGNEGAGLSAETVKLATAAVSIPIAGVESLNVAAAAAVCLFEQVRQRL